MNGSSRDWTRRKARPRRRGAARSALALAVIALSARTAALSQDGAAPVTNLDQAVAAALAAAPGLAAARAEVEAAGSGVRIARAPGRPQAALGAAYEVGTGTYDPGPNGRALLGALPSGPEDALSLAGQNGNGRASAQASVSQLFYAGGQVRAGVARAQAAQGAARARLRGAEQDVALGVIDAYTALRAARARRAAGLVARDRFAAELGAARTRFEAGTGTRTDVALAEAEAAGAEGRIAEAEAAASSALAALAAFGVMPDGLRASRDLPAAVPPSVPLDIESAVETALRESPTVLAQEQAVAAASEALRQQRARRAPRLRTRAAATWGEDRFLTGDEATALTVTAEVEVPLLQGGAVRAGIAEARARLRGEQAALDAARAQSEAETRAVYARLRGARAVLDAARLRLDAARLADQGARLEREVGRRSAQDTLRVAALAAEAEAGLADAQRAHALAAFSLRAAMGNLLTMQPVSGQSSP